MTWTRISTRSKGVAGRISSYKNNLITPKAYQSRADLQEADAAARMPKIGALYAAHTWRNASERGAHVILMTYYSRPMSFLPCFRRLLQRYQERFKYILVDEYQDTNHSQYLIVKALASRYENLCVVGRRCPKHLCLPKVPTFGIF